jgi:hypothetical protein
MTKERAAQGGRFDDSDLFLTDSDCTPAKSGSQCQCHHAPRVIAQNWRPREQNTLRGFADLEFHSVGLVIKGCSLHSKEGKYWVSLPAKPFEKDGKRCWEQFLEIPEKAHWQAFQKAALAAVQSLRGGAIG